MENLEAKLIQDGWLDAHRIELARQEAAKYGRSIWAMFVKLGFLSLDDIAVFFAQESGVPYVNICDYLIGAEAARLIDEDFCRQNTVVPLFKIKDSLFVACANPLDTALTDALTKLAGCDIVPLLATSFSIIKALNAIYGIEDKVFESEKFLTTQEPLKGLAFWRESERLPLNIAVSIKIEDRSFTLSYASSIDGYTRDISYSGTAIGLEVFLFLPKGIAVTLEFKPDKNLTAADKVIIKVRGEIAYCRMEKGRHYFLGVRFTEITGEARNQLFALASRH